MSAQTCGDRGGLTKAGAPCSVTMNLSPTTGRCVVHDPERSAAFQSKGGNTAKVGNRIRKAADPANVPAAPRTLEDAVTLAAWITRAVLIGDIDSRTADAATKAVRQFQLGEEKRGLEEEIKKLRAELAAANKQLGSKPVFGVARGGGR